MFPGTHGLHVFALEQFAPGERPQKTDADLGRDFGQPFGTEALGSARTRTARAIGLENPINDDAMEMPVRIEPGAEAMKEGECAHA